MIFISGTIVGLIIALLIAVLEVYLSARGRAVLETITKKIEKQAQPSAKIFIPKSDEDQALENYVKEKDTKGEDIKLDELN